MMVGNCPIAPAEGWAVQKPPPGVGIDRDHPLSRNLAARWMFNEGVGGSVWDACGVNPGLWYGGGLHWAPTRLGTGGWFSTNNYVTASSLSSFNQVTLHVAFMTTSTATQYLFTCGRPYLIGSGFGFLLAGGKVYFDVAYVGQGTSPNRLIGPTISVNQIYSITATYDGSKVVVYLNGTVAASTTWNVVMQFVSGYTDYLFGKEPASGTYLQGSILDVSVWNKALSSDMIRSLVASPYSMFESGRSLSSMSGRRSLIDGSPASATLTGV